MTKTMSMHAGSAARKYLSTPHMKVIYTPLPAPITVWGASRATSSVKCMQAWFISTTSAVNYCRAVLTKAIIVCLLIPTGFALALIRPIVSGWMHHRPGISAIFICLILKTCRPAGSVPRQCLSMAAVTMQRISIRWLEPCQLPIFQTARPTSISIRGRWRSRSAKKTTLMSKLTGQRVSVSVNAIAI